MSRVKPHCSSCKHFAGFDGGQDGSIIALCEAFPEAPGIPWEIIENDKPHIEWHFCSATSTFTSRRTENNN